MALQPLFLTDFYTFWSLAPRRECRVSRKELKMKKDIIAAHEYCTNNKESLQRDSVCGCFYCLKIFSPTEIAEWIPDTKGTALCPYCDIDSVIGESSGYPITKEFLEEMKKYWF